MTGKFCFQKLPEHLSFDRLNLKIRICIHIRQSQVPQKFAKKIFRHEHCQRRQTLFKRPVHPCHLQMHAHQFTTIVFSDGNSSFYARHKIVGEFSNKVVVFFGFRLSLFTIVSLHVLILLVREEAKDPFRGRKLNCAELILKR